MIVNPDALPLGHPAVGPAVRPSVAPIKNRPDIQGRKAIFEVHLKGLTLSDKTGVFSGRLAGLTPGFVGADIENLCNEAAIIAARRSKKKIEMDDFEVRVLCGKKCCPRMRQASFDWFDYYVRFALFIALFLCPLHPSLCPFLVFFLFFSVGAPGEFRCPDYLILCMIGRPTALPVYPFCADITNLHVRVL